MIDVSPEERENEEDEEEGKRATTTTRTHVVALRDARCPVEAEQEPSSRTCVHGIHGARVSDDE